MGSGSSLVAGWGKAGINGQRRPGCRVNVSSGERVAEFWQSSRPVWSVAWSVDGSYLAAGNGVYNSRTANGQVFILEAP